MSFLSQVMLRRQYNRFRDRNFLPCTVFCRNPLVLASYDTDFLRNAPAFLAYFDNCRAKSIHVFIQLGWEHETQKNAVPFAAAVKDILSKCDRLRVTVLANSENEVRTLSSLGLRTVFCNQNAFVDESRYPVLHTEKTFDAIYIARVTPFKRHFLAEKVPSIRLIGDFAWLEAEKPYARDILSNRLKHAVWTPHLRSSQIPGEIAKAHCGLCLSKEEGAMFVSIEYLLCGLPVVNTANIGGRDAMLPDFAVKTVPDDPDAVAAAVREFVWNAPPPEKIRAATLEIMNRHREVFRGLLNEAMAPKVFPASRKFQHKLFLRCTGMPWQMLKYQLIRPRGL